MAEVIEAAGEAGDGTAIRNTCIALEDGESFDWATNQVVRQAEPG